MNKMNCSCAPSSLSIPSNQGNMSCSATTCQNQLFYNDLIQPTRRPNTIAPLNSLGIRYDGTAQQVSTNMKNCTTGWISPNPLTYDVERAIQTVFDEPNYTGQVNVGNVCHDEIYSPMYSRYGKGYRNYMDINAGQIRYYIDNTQAEVYNDPNFTTPSAVRNRLFVDPMGTVKPQYDRFPLTPYSWNKPYDACDSSTHDALVFRQDMMEKQMRKMNQEDWVYRWGNVVSDQSKSKD